VNSKNNKSLVTVKSYNPTWEPVANHNVMNTVELDSRHLCMGIQWHWKIIELDEVTQNFSSWLVKI